MSTSDIETTFENLDIEMIDEPDTGEAVTIESVDREWHLDQLRRAEAAHEIANAPDRERRERERQKAEQKAAGRVAASGGETVRTELRGEVGQAVADVLRLDRIADAARKVAHRIDEERREIEARRLDDLDAEVLAAAWTAAESKARVPEVLAPAWEHATREVTAEHRIGATWTAERLLAKVHAEHAERNGARVVEALAEVERVLVEYAEDTLAGAGTAADDLTTAGLSPNASAEDVLAHGGAEVGAAWRAWREAVTAWAEVQSARRWLAVAVERGFSETTPEGLAHGEGVDDIEARVWRSQFEGSRVGVQSAEDALVWWTENGRPAPTGVGSSEKAGASK